MRSRSLAEIHAGKTNAGTAGRAASIAAIRVPASDTLADRITSAWLASRAPRSIPLPTYTRLCAVKWCRLPIETSVCANAPEPCCRSLPKLISFRTMLWPLADYAYNDSALTKLKNLPRTCHFAHHDLLLLKSSTIPGTKSAHENLTCSRQPAAEKCSLQCLRTMLPCQNSTHVRC